MVPVAWCHCVVTVAWCPDRSPTDPFVPLITRASHAPNSLHLFRLPLVHPCPSSHIAPHGSTWLHISPSSPIITHLPWSSPSSSSPSPPHLPSSWGIVLIGIPDLQYRSSSSGCRPPGKQLRASQLRAIQVGAKRCSLMGSYCPRPL